MFVSLMRGYQTFSAVPIIFFPHLSSVMAGFELPKQLHPVGLSHVLDNGQPEYEKKGNEAEISFTGASHAPFSALQNIYRISKIIV